MATLEGMSPRLVAQAAGLQEHEPFEFEQACVRSRSQVASPPVGLFDGRQLGRVVPPYEPPIGEHNPAIRGEKERLGSEAR